MDFQLEGIHHVTAMARSPRQNLEFYRNVVGLRLVKRTVNFDDPGTYHFYYGDGKGQPGTILTFFPWPDAYRGRPGIGQVTEIAFSVPSGAVQKWAERFADEALDFGTPFERFGDQVLPFRDPDGIYLELVENGDHDARFSWRAGPVPPGMAVGGFYASALSVEDVEGTARLLVEVFGYTPEAENDDRTRFLAGGNSPGNRIDLLRRPGTRRGTLGTGVVHHIAFRAADEEEQLELQKKLAGRGFNVTPVRDRQYFKSIYFRGPGGVLFEIATDGPGMLIDEDENNLGASLRLPPWYEERRGEIEARLPEVTS